MSATSETGSAPSLGAPTPSQPSPRHHSHSLSPSVHASPALSPFEMMSARRDSTGGSVILEVSSSACLLPKQQCVSEKETLQAQIATLKLENQRLIAEAHSHAATNERLNALETEKKAAETRHAEIVSKLEDELQTLRNQVTALTQINATLRASIADWEARHAASEKRHRDAEERLQQTEEQLAAMQIAHKTLQQQVDAEYCTKVASELLKEYEAELNAVLFPNTLLEYTNPHFQVKVPLPKLLKWYDFKSNKLTAAQHIDVETRLKDLRLASPALVAKTVDARHMARLLLANMQSVQQVRLPAAHLSNQERQEVSQPVVTPAAGSAPASTSFPRMDLALDSYVASQGADALLAGLLHGVKLRLAQRTGNGGPRQLLSPLK